jgi:type IV pilus assembly protein PilV
MQLRAIWNKSAAGLALLEVLVTLVITSIGILGVVKMQAAAIANTQVARVRSLIALQTQSLAAAMHGNQSYWAAGQAPATFSMTGVTVTDSTATVNCPVLIDTPVACTVTTTWRESYLAYNQATAAKPSSQTAMQSLTLHVHP